jgi:membrane protein
VVTEDAEPAPRRRGRLARAVSRRFPRVGRAVVDPGLALATQTAEDSLGVQAGSLTYGAFLSIPPALLLVGSATGFLLANDPQAQARVVDRIASAIPGLEPVMKDLMQSTVNGRVSVGLVGLIGLVWTASGFAARARCALGVIFRTARTGLLVGRVEAIVMGIPIIAVLLGAAAAVGFVGHLQGSGSFAVLSRVAIEVVVLAGSFAVFLVAYRMLTPGAGPSLRAHVPGAVVFAVGSALARVVGEVYVGVVVARSTALYGAIGAIFGLLAFLYALNWVFLLGAELTRFRGLRTGRIGAPDVSDGHPDDANPK